MPRSPRLRRQPWPEWSAEEYETLIESAQAVQTGSRAALKVVHNQDDPELINLLGKLRRYARDTELSIAKIEIGRFDRAGERWPRWSLKAIDVAIDQSSTLLWKIELASIALMRKNRAELERLMNDCLLIGQRMELVLLDGPPPENGRN